MRRFETGATRDTDEGKADYEGFLNPLVIKRYGEYMLKHQVQADGALRSSDNWQNGMPKDAYIKSGWRHFLDWWLEHRGQSSRAGLQDALCALIFNAMGYLLEDLKEPIVSVSFDEEVADLTAPSPFSFEKSCRTCRWFGTSIGYRCSYCFNPGGDPYHWEVQPTTYDGGVTHASH